MSRVAPCVLVVDDDAEIAAMMTAALEEEGYTVATASGGAAVPLAAETQPAMVLLDLMMPGVDGFEVLRSLRAEPSTRDLPVIVVTAKDLTDEDRQRLARSAERVIQKQAVPLDTLRDEIRGLLTTTTQRRSEEPSTPRPSSA